MKVSVREKTHTVLDDVFSPTEFEELRAKFFADDLKQVGHFNTKVFSVSDGIVYRGTPLHFQVGNPPPLKYMAFFHRLVALHKEHFDAPQYSAVSVTPWCYPQGSALTWHDDAGNFYAGSYVYYLHTEWKPTWGGLLLIADDECGGKFIFPKPNRLVFIPRGVPHSISRVDKNAGENNRLSLTGFFFA